MHALCVTASLMQFWFMMSADFGILNLSPGIALSRRFFLPFGATLSIDQEFSARINEKVKPIIRLFTPIFS